MENLYHKIIVALVMLVLGGAFGWTTLVRSESNESNVQQQAQIDAVRDALRYIAIESCNQLPTLEERNGCVERIKASENPPPPPAPPQE